MKVLDVPQNALVMMFGAAGSGKSWFASTHFKESEIVSSDECRQMVSDDMMDQSCNKQAFALYHQWIRCRLALGRRTVADATNVTAKARKALREIAEEFGVPVVVIWMDTPPEETYRRNATRNRVVPEWVIAKHLEQAKQGVKVLAEEGYYAVYAIRPGEDYQIRQSVPLVAPGWDVIGDIHGCLDELEELVRQLGYDLSTLEHPEGRRLAFVGDYTDRGPKNLGVLRFVKAAVAAGHVAVMGNHDNKLWRWLKGNNVKISHGLSVTVREFLEIPDSEQAVFRDFLGNLPYQRTLQVTGHPDLIVAHAGVPRDGVGIDTNSIRSHCLYGQVVKIENGWPERSHEWTGAWTPGDDQPWCVYGHTVHDEPVTMFNTIDIDTGCVFGGKLTALRYPEFDFVSVPAAKNYAEEVQG